jgi:hypothetical protein
MSRAGDPALMHEVLDLLKAAHIKVSFSLPPLFEAKFLPAEAEDVLYRMSLLIVAFAQLWLQKRK